MRKLVSLLLLFSFLLTANTYADGIDSYVKCILHMDGTDASTTFTDASSSAHSFTPSGNAQIDTAQSQFGGASGLFDGSGDYISCSDTLDDFRLGASGAGNDWTIDYWIRWNDGSATNRFMGNYNGSNGWHLVLRRDIGPNMNIWSSGTDATFSGTHDPSNSTWYHHAFVKNGTTITFYVNGTSVGTISDMTMNNGGNFYIGSGNFGATLNGWLDEVRISKGIARWTSNFTTPTQAYSSSSIKTINGLSVASVKTVNGLAIGSVKTKNDLS